MIGGGALLLAGAAAYGWRAATGTMSDYNSYAAQLRAPLATDPSALDLIRYATLAANSHNAQPWHFRIGDNVIDVLPDMARATPVVDPDDHHLFVTLGCAAENLAIAAAATGHAGDVQVDNTGDVHVDVTKGPAHRSQLFDAIPRRQSTRAVYDGRPVSAEDLETLRKSAQMDGVRLVLITDRTQIDQVRDLVIAGNTAQLHNPAFMAELKHWLRFNPRDAMARGDGLFTAASGNPVMPSMLGGFAVDTFFTPSAENDKYARQINSSAGLAIFVSEREDKAHWVATGRACQRFALAATALSLKHAFVNQPVEVAALRSELATLIGEPGLRPDLVMRFGYGAEMPFSPRRLVEAVVIP